MIHRKFGVVAGLLFGLALMGSAMAAPSLAQPATQTAQSPAAIQVTPATQVVVFAKLAPRSTFLSEVNACSHVTPENFCSCYPEHCGHG